MIVCGGAIWVSQLPHKAHDHGDETSHMYDDARERRGGQGPGAVAGLWRDAAGLEVRNQEDGVAGCALPAWGARPIGVHLERNRGPATDVACTPKSRRGMNTESVPACQQRLRNVARRGRLGQDRLRCELEVGAVQADTRPRNVARRKATGAAKGVEGDAEETSADNVQELGDLDLCAVEEVWRESTGQTGGHRPWAKYLDHESGTDPWEEQMAKDTGGHTHTFIASTPAQAASTGARKTSDRNGRHRSLDELQESVALHGPYLKCVLGE